MKNTNLNGITSFIDKSTNNIQRKSRLTAAYFILRLSVVYRAKKIVSIIFILYICIWNNKSYILEEICKYE